MDGPPPPPPPHGEKPSTTQGEYRKSSDLPPGNYDIFIIPPHSSGSGFLYLPSLQCHRNSFIAGSTWYAATIASGSGTGMAVLAIGVGIAGWAFGVSQADTGGSQQGSRPGPGGFGSGGFGTGGAGAGARSHQSSGAGTGYSRGANFGGQSEGQQGNFGGNFGGPPPGNQYAGNQYGAGAPPPHPQPDAGSGPTDGGSASNKNESKPQTGPDWEKAREETRRKEELRRKMQEFKRKREAEAREKQKQREREAMERELRERREQLEKEMAAAREQAANEAREQAARAAAEARAKAEREAAEAKARKERAEREAREKAEREAAEAKSKAEREAAEAKAKAEKEAAEKEAAAKAAAKKEADAKFAALKEAAAKKYAEKKAKDAQEAAAKEAAAAKETASKASSQKSAGAGWTPSPKKPPFPNARTATATMAPEDDAYSFRPYDRPRRPYAATSKSSVYSESSYAPSQSTARTSPPPSQRGPYSTKDPDKIVIRGVFAFNNAFPRTPVTQLVSGQGMVTDGLVLRITTEGLFIDDDVRGVPQREWDVKAWTMKLAEVWCPQYQSQKKEPPKPSNLFFRRGTGEPTAEESDAYLNSLLKVCKNTCRLASPACFSRNGSAVDSETQGLHVLRASIRDQEGRRYVFVLPETEGWKVGIGLQRLRGGTQVRALGVTNMAANESRTILGHLSFA
ncbi:hypothetical protein EYZ11_009724 [Aspergillus tanneri]|uniref:Uncharacterized protein n=1 Tax=Aspergillus tanneri TaxID=1220188 RepID=A0A4S3J7E5_9EURO|nr:hypothetical protein EYZ11_009724 [Aspergillus tanneri]